VVHEAERLLIRCDDDRGAVMDTTLAAFIVIIVERHVSLCVGVLVLQSGASDWRCTSATTSNLKRRPHS
jgi:hypothetical protein